MLTIKDFHILRFFCEARGNVNQRLCADATGYSLGTVNSTILDLMQRGYLDKRYNVTEDGFSAMAPYKVHNAIILAAGMSSRFIPVSYELPKGLISVKGEVMTERLIRQLQEAGIHEIVLVVGYMMEKFFYLRDKFNVKLVVNNEFSTKNTHSSIYVARDHLCNTYICCSDNYYPKNMFHQYEYHAFYCSIYMPGTSYVERAFSFDKSGLITDTNKPSHDQWVMYGHAYYDSAFTNAFKPILENYYGRPGIEYMYWETIYAENVKQLPMHIHQCTPEDILEFDSMEELKLFDREFIRHNRIKIFENICKILCCDISDISDIEPIKQGLNNRSFQFLVNDKKYIYRHPGPSAEHVIDRKKEATALRMAKKLKVDTTLVYIDEEEGWKISRYIDTEEPFNFSKKSHIALLSNSLKNLHNANIKVGFGFNYESEAKKLIEMEKFIDGISYKNLLAVQDYFQPIFDWLKTDVWQISLCHNDLYSPNLLVHGNSLDVIDWEFAGDADIGYDICKLFAVHNPPYEEIDDWLYIYYGRSTTEAEKLHLCACAAIIYYYWYIWAVYASKNGEQVSEYLMVWYDKMMHFGSIVINKIKENSKWK